jgi:hypothetical protein
MAVKNEVHKAPTTVVNKNVTITRRIFSKVDPPLADPEAPRGKLPRQQIAE